MRDKENAFLMMKMLYKNLSGIDDTLNQRYDEQPS